MNDFLYALANQPELLPALIAVVATGCVALWAVSYIVWASVKPAPKHHHSRRSSRRVARRGR